MNPVFSKFKTSAVCFPRHVQQRVLQRFRLYMTKSEQQNVEHFLRQDFNTACVNFARHMSPFYVNKMDSAHGKNSFVATSKYLNYYGNYDEVSRQLVIKTVYVKKKDVKVV